MKKLFQLAVALFVSDICFSQLLQQDFQSSTLVPTYVNAAPNNGQFTQITSTGGSSVVALLNRLDFTRAASGICNYVRSVGFSSSPTSLMIRFDVFVSGNSTVNTTQGELFLGTTTTGVSSFADNTSAPLNGNTYARIDIGWTATAGQWFVRDVTNTTTGTTQTGTKTVLWVVNKSGGTLTYWAPNGTNESILNGTADVWVGTLHEFNDVNVQTASITAIDKTKFIFSGGNGTMSIDNMLYDPIPLVPNSSAPTGISETSFTAHWTPVAGVTGYRIDIATDAGFTTMVPGFNNLYIAGQATSSLLISGLSPGTTFYYRIRGASQYTVGEFNSGSSATQSSATFLLPVRLQNFQAYLNNRKPELVWSTSAEMNTKSFEIERSSNGRNFVRIAVVNSKGNASGNNYRFTDNFPLEGKNYYRLNIVDIDGKTDYSSILLVSNSASAVMVVYPNPAEQYITLQYPKARVNSKISIVNVNGIKMKVWSVPVNSVQMNLPVNDLLYGDYFVLYDDGQHQISTRFIKK